VLLKKFERVAKFKALEVEKERFVIHGEKVEHASFLVGHESKDWPSLVMEVLATASRLLPEWRIQFATASMRGSIGDVLTAYVPGYKLPVSGLRSILWEINEQQLYVRTRWLNGTPDRW
jgi:hypothetical protein